MRAIYQFCEKKQTEYPDGKTEVSKSLLWVTIALRAKGIRATLNSVSRQGKIWLKPGGFMQLALGAQCPQPMKFPTVKRVGGQKLYIMLPKQEH